MKASVLIGPQTSEVRDVPIPEMGYRDVLVRVEACGVCFSEFHQWHREAGTMYPTIMGHEPSGVIEGIGEGVASLEVGQRVTILPTRRGPLTHYKSQAYAEYVVAPEERVVVVPQVVELTKALGEPIACLVSAAERTRVHLAERVAIVGCGFMGLALLQFVRLRGPKEIIAVDVRDHALAQALALGADRALHPDEIDPHDKLTEWQDLGQGIDVVFEVSGTQSGLTLSSELVKAHGILSIVGYHADGLRTVDVGLWNWKAIDVVNAHERRNDFLMKCMQVGIDLIAAGKLNLASLVTHTYTLNEVDAAFAAMRDKPLGFIKAVILPQK